MSNQIFDDPFPFAQGRGSHEEKSLRKNSPVLVEQLVPAQAGGSPVVLVMPNNYGQKKKKKKDNKFRDGRWHSTLVDSATADLPTQVLFVPPVDGMYYLSMGVTVITSSSSTGSATLSMTYTPVANISTTVTINDAFNVVAASSFYPSASPGLVWLMGNAPVLIGTTGINGSSAVLDIAFSAERMA